LGLKFNEPLLTDGFGSAGIPVGNPAAFVPFPE
jgi:hypothetical protein